MVHYAVVFLVKGSLRKAPGGEKLKISSKTKKTKKYLNDIFIYLEDPFFDGENRF